MHGDQNPPAVSTAPRAVLHAFHQSGFDVTARRESEKRTLFDYATESGQCAAHKKRALLPVSA